MHPVIEVKNLTKHFKEITAVKDLSFTVFKGDVYGFLGQNGAGKSTTIRMLLTLICASEGNIKIFGKELLDERHEILKNIGAIIERPDLYKFLSAKENLSVFAKMSGVKVPAKKIMQQLEMVGLADRANSKVKTYSQGMKQRLGIAIALVHDPELVILDEPTNGLDPQGIADMRNLLINLSKNHGKTILVSSHLLNEIEMIANRIIIIHKGEKIVEGTADELLDPAKTVVELDTVDNEFTKRVLATSQWAPSTQDSVDSTILVQMDRSRIPLLTDFLVKERVQVISIQPRNSLEDYFLSLTTERAHVELTSN
ncbi:MAG: ABC transporter ATP-binding protein [Chitinophagaceae bacterium]